MYISDWFIKASSYAGRNSDQWYILSAKYGLLSPHQIIEPYNETLNTMPIAQGRALGAARPGCGRNHGDGLSLPAYIAPSLVA